MRKKMNLFFLLACFAGMLANAQLVVKDVEFFKIPLKGIAPEVEQQLLPYDLISQKPVNIKVTIDTLSSTKNSFSRSRATSSHSYVVQFDPVTKHYDINVMLRIKVRKGFLAKLDKPVTITVSAPTVFGNYIWTKVERNKDNLTDPIILDKYTSINEKTNKKPEYSINLESNLFLSTIRKKLIDGDKLLSDEKGIIVNVKLKNASQVSYMTNMALSDNKRGSLYKKVPMGKKTDPSKPIEILISIPTTYGNYLWKKLPINNKLAVLKVDFYNCNYSGEEGNTEAVLSRTVKAIKPLAGTNIEPKPEEETIEEIKPRPSVEKPQEVIKTPETSNLYELKQHKGTIEITNVHNYTIKGNVKSTLLKDTSILVGGQSIAIKGNNPINFNAEKKYIITAIANKSQTITTAYGPITIKDGELIRFSPYKVTGLNLKENVEITTTYGKVMVKAKNDGNPYDVTFTDNGKLTRLTLAETKSFEIGNHIFPIPAESVVKMNNDKVIAFNISQDIPFEIEDLKITITSGNTKVPSVGFDSKTNTISKVYVSASSDITTSDGPLKVNENSAMYLQHDGTKYLVERFEIGETKDISTYKKNGKVKVKTAKKGKDIILVDGKVRRIGW